MRPTIPLALAAAAITALTGCGGGQGGSAEPTRTAGAPGARAVTIEADPSGGLRWLDTRALAGAGQVRITLRNPSSVPHDLHLTGAGVDAMTRTVADGSDTITVRLKPGEYEFRCDVPGHESMRGTLTVD